MKNKNILLSVALLLGFSLAMMTQSCSSSDNSNSDSSTTSWQNLFNGENLDGWHQLNGHAKFGVENGEIVGTTVFNTPNSFLCTDSTYGDFILEVEYKVDSTMNSGIQIRSESKPDYRKGRVHGYQIEIDPSSRAWSAGIYDEGRRGWLYPLIYNHEAQKAFKQNQWNHYHIECVGNTIRTWINGVPAASLVDSMTHRGFIALQVHSVGNDKSKVGEEIRWRNVRIQTKNLKPRPFDSTYVVNLIPNTLSPQEKYQGFQMLWDGKTSRNWRGIYKKVFPKDGWTMNDGVLTIHQSNGRQEGSGGDIITEKQYGAFVFQFSFKLTKGANSGVKYFVKESYNTNGMSGIGLEYQVLDDKNHPDAKKGRDGDRTLSSLYDLIPRKSFDSLPPRVRAVVALPIGKWNHGRIIVYPNDHVEHWLNGYRMISYVKGSKEFKHLVAISKYKDWKNFGLWKEGHILLQDHGNMVSFRNLKIKVLK